jgi:hypothetical protein
VWQGHAAACAADQLNPLSGIAMNAYHLEVTTFEPSVGSIKSVLERPEDVSASLVRLPRNSVVFVAAIKKNVDYGNFYLFLNSSGHAHVMLHEHREFLPRDPLSAGAVGEVTFLSEDGTQFTVPSVLATSADRGRMALEYWLPNQERWPEFSWE